MIVLTSSKESSYVDLREELLSREVDGRIFEELKPTILTLSRVCCIDVGYTTNESAAGTVYAVST